MGVEGNARPALAPVADGVDHQAHAGRLIGAGAGGGPMIVGTMTSFGLNVVFLTFGAVALVASGITFCGTETKGA